MTDLTGQYLGRYYLTERLGEGGMAVVYKAYDTRLERDVAVKIIRGAAFRLEELEEVLKRFEREAKSLAKLSHPNIVKVYDYGEHDGSPYLVMEYLPGGTLRKQLGKMIHWRKAVQLVLPVARGISYAHQRGILHRDIKPANILLTDSGEPMLSDFGIAKLFESEKATTLTGSGIAIGTPEYMAPEQWNGITSPQSDLYSLAIVLYEMVAGRKPYVADTPAAILIKQATEPLPSPRTFTGDLPEELEHTLIKALAREPGDRYTDVNTFIAALEQIGRIAPVIQPSQTQTAIDNSWDPTEKVPYASDSSTNVDVVDPPVASAPHSELPKAQSVSWQRFPASLRYGVAGAILLFGLWLSVSLAGRWFSPVDAATPTMSVTRTPRLPTSAPATSPPATPTSTAVRPTATQATATPTPEPGPGFTIVNPQEVIKIAASLDTLGQLAVEKYSLESRNRVNATLTYTINAKPDVSMLWRWYWCAATDRILDRNMSNITVMFDADGYLIPQEEIATVEFENGSDPVYKGWKCLAYETVLRDWKPGTYALIQTTTISNAINDGREIFDAGYKIYEYTVNISR